jgi:integrase/recombinase XerD
MSSPARDDRARLVPATTVAELWIDLVRRAEQGEGLSDRTRALQFRDGGMLGIFGACGIRPKNVAALAIGTSLQRRSDEWWVAFNAPEMKNKRPYEVPLPGLTWLIDRYIEHYRPYLLTRSKPPIAGNALWLSDTGKPLTAKQVGQIITRRTERELGCNLNPRLLRKLIPTELAIRDPKHVGTAQPLLGHADYQTTQQAYNLGRALDAARRHQEVLRTIRRQGSPDSRQQGRRSSPRRGS